MSRLPEKCPVCGEKIEKGILRAEGGGVGILRWRTPEMSSLNGGERLAFNILAVDVGAVRCRNCKIVIFSHDGKK